MFACIISEKPLEGLLETHNGSSGLSMEISNDYEDVVILNDYKM